MRSLTQVLPKSLCEDIQPMILRETIASSPDPTMEPMPEKKKTGPL